MALLLSCSMNEHTSIWRRFRANNSSRNERLTFAQSFTLRLCRYCSGLGMAMCSQEEKAWQPAMETSQRSKLLSQWRKAVGNSMNWVIQDKGSKSNDTSSPAGNFRPMRSQNKRPSNIDTSSNSCNFCA